VITHSADGTRSYGPLRERLAAKIEISDGDGCWLWTGFCDKRGYGFMGSGRKGKVERVHRVAWREFRGPIPPAMVVCHRCDNPSCARPSHLFLGTQQENIADMVAKGRQRSRRGEMLDTSGKARGDRHWSRSNPGLVRRGNSVNTSKLDERSVRRIRSLAKEGRSFKSMGREFGVSDASIAAIVYRKSWRHIA